MGISSSFKYGAHERVPDTIVLLQWENSATISAPRLRFWTIRFPAPTKTSPKTKAPLPIPTAVHNGIDETGCLSFGAERRKDRLHLPPLVGYHRSSRSIITHNLMASDTSTDGEILSWGPGLRLRKIRITDNFFEEPVVSLSNARLLSSSAIQGDAWGTKLTAVAHETVDGSILVKYRSRTTNVAWKPLATNENKVADLPKEQVVRTALIGATADASVCSPIPGSSVPLHCVTVGSTAYTILISVGRGKDGSKTQISLYTASESDVKAEAESVRRPREDLGLRWQVQNFFLPDGVTNVAPVVVACSEKPYPSYLVLFYTYQGAMYYSHMRYAGSGFFQNHVIGVPCLLALDPEEQQVAPAQKASTSSRWSFSPISRPAQKASTLEKGPMPDESSSEETRQKPILTASRGCQPAVIKANRNLYLFYVGPDGKARYASCSSYPKEISEFGSSWEEVSWDAEPLLSSKSEGETENENCPISRHFFPVVVPADFMVEW